MATIGASVELTDMMSAPLGHIMAAAEGLLDAWVSLDSAIADGFNVNGVEQIRAELAQAGNGLDELEEKQKKFNQQMNHGAGAAEGLTGKIGDIGRMMQGLKKLADLSDAYVQTQARFSMIVDEGADVAALNDKIFASAQRARAGYQDMADVVLTLSLNAGGAFSSNDEAILFAENLNKLYTIAGTEQQAAASSTLQLTQALESGVLRGEEFNAVLGAAPSVMRAVADYMNVPIGKLRGMAAEGQITAGIVKNALLSATDDINAQFDTMPMTWGQVWTGVMNELYMASAPILGFISMLAQNWSILEPIVIGIAAAVGLYTAALLINKAVSAGAVLVEGVKAAQTALSNGLTLEQAAATMTAAGAQAGFNAALLACPLTWVLVIIIAVIAAIYAIVAAINKMTGSTLSATGIIAGVVAVAGAVILNTGVGVLNSLIQALWTIFVEPFLGIIEWVLNVCNGGFNGFGGAVANLIGNIISWFLSLGKVVTKIIDAIFGTDWTSGLSALQDNVLAWGKNENAITLDRSAPTIDYRVEYGGAWDAGYGFGEGVGSKFSSVFGAAAVNGYDMTNLQESIGAIPEIGDIATNTGNIADTLDVAHGDLKYLRDLAEQDAINRYTTAEIKVEMGGVNNNISQNMDLDGVIDYMVTGVQEAMERAAEGVHS